MEESSSKTLRFLIVCYFIFSVVFWIVLFMVSPNYVEFAVLDVPTKTMQIPDNRNVYLYGIDSKGNYDKIKQTEKTQDTVGIILFLYGSISYGIMFSVIDKKSLHKAYLPLFICWFVAVFIISNFYYNYIFAPFAGRFLSIDYTYYFVLLKSLPTTLIAYVIMRKIFMHFTHEEPKIVGKFGLINDPDNWIFTMLVNIAGISAAFFLPWLF